jgi:NAD(P)-dependent dehydrogenase (short-subunit alcohol dehydrogenase family)
MPSPGWTFTPTFHREPYPAISPSRPELSQAGRTVLVTGGSGGIGSAITEAFLAANAAKVIIIGRGKAALDKAVSGFVNVKTEGRIEGRACDMSSPEAIGKLWKGLGDDGIHVDVLVLNAAAIPEPKTILELGTGAVWKDFEVNVRAQLDFVERLHNQSGEAKNNHKVRPECMPIPRCRSDNKQSVVHISTFAIHDWEVSAQQPSYGLTKNAGALVLQQIAKDVSPEAMQIVNVNPGPNLTQTARDNGYTEDDFAWNSGESVLLCLRKPTRQSQPSNV